jgi:hypothetical protein
MEGDPLHESRQSADPQYGEPLDMPSQPNKPDLDWSQIKETVMMLNLAVSRIERTMKDGDDSVTTLADLFTSIMGNVGAIGKAADKLPDSREKETITANFDRVSKKMNEAIVAFQFYDRLTQRLSHISHSLAALADLVSDSGRLYNPYEWFGLQDMIKSKYTMDIDRAMFDAIINGATVEEALQTLPKSTATVPEDNIELFD